MKQGRWVFNKARKVFEPTVKEEHVLREIVTRLWLEMRIKVWRVRERIPDKKKRWQQLSTPGIPDLIGWVADPMQQGVEGLRGRVWPLFIEVKRPGGVHRAAQERFIAAARADGCIAFFADSWQCVLDNLRGYGINSKGGT